jgi:hypothetical protein
MSLADKKIVGPSFPNAVEVVRVVWDFAVDGGAIADYDVLEASAECIVKLRHAHALTALESSDAINIDLGKGDGGVEFMSNALKASLAGNLCNVGTGAAVYLAAGNKIVMGIEAYAATAGKVEFVFEVIKAN